ncbi:MAG: hydroxyacid dehydrogenase [Candidatus Latescibacteria bacterium]|nr:hydroxyacid dehydrogenase [Candidatus Latescibacterota bacterium]
MARPKVLIACGQRVRDQYLPTREIERLEAFADWDWFACEGGGIEAANEDIDAANQLAERIDGVDALVVCHGSPRIDAKILERADKLRFIGELEGDRFSARIDLDAAWARGIRTVDTTNGSSYPVAEWALGLILVSVRNAGANFRRIISGVTPSRGDKTEMCGSLWGKRVGIIGGGHMGRRLMKLLRPFEVEMWVHDPYLPREMGEALGFLQTSFDQIFSLCDVIVCVAPLTPKTRGMIGQRELNMIRSGSVFVNVSRGAIVDSSALVERLKRGDIVAGLDVFDPEPIPADNEIIDLPNVFLSPHIGWATGDDSPHFFNLMVDELDRFFAGHETHFDLTPRAKANRLGDEPPGS